MEIKTLDLRRRDQGTGTGKLMNVTELLPRNEFTPEFVYHFKRWGRGGGSGQTLPQPKTPTGCRSGSPAWDAGSGREWGCEPCRLGVGGQARGRGPGLGRRLRTRTHLSANRAGESGLVDSRSCMAFHSLMQLCSEPMQLS